MILNDRLVSGCLMTNCRPMPNAEKTIQYIEIRWMDVPSWSATPNNCIYPNWAERRNMFCDDCDGFRIKHGPWYQQWIMIFLVFLVYVCFLMVDTLKRTSSIAGATLQQQKHFQKSLVEPWPFALFDHIFITWGLYLPHGYLWHYLVDSL